MIPRRSSRRFGLVILIAVMSSLSPSVSQAGAAAEQRIFGWVEWVTLTDTGLRLKAKLDTGAATSSIHAENIERFKRDGVRMVKFDLVDPDSRQAIVRELEVERSVKIREHDGSFQRRPVVAMEICIGGLSRTIEVNLVDRSQFIYPFLLGRSAMSGKVIVDPGETFTATLSCAERGTVD